MYQLFGDFISIHLCVTNVEYLENQSLICIQLAVHAPKGKNPIDFSDPLTFPVALLLDQTFCIKDILNDLTVMTSTVHIYSQEDDDEEAWTGL